MGIETCIKIKNLIAIMQATIFNKQNSIKHEHTRVAWIKRATSTPDMHRINHNSPYAVPRPTHREKNICGLAGENTHEAGNTHARPSAEVAHLTSRLLIWYRNIYIYIYHMCKKLCESPRHLICGHLSPQMRGRDRAHSMILKLVHPTRDRVTLHDKV